MPPTSTQSLSMNTRYGSMISLLGGALVLVHAATAQAAPPAGWDCDEAAYEDGLCDCGCGANDADCTPGATFEVCETSACPEGQVPWEHSPGDCMSSACGDGWLDERRGEVCDDGEGLAGGGCNADCSAVNDGWSCGTEAQKCTPLADEPEPADAGHDAAMPDAGDAGGAADAARPTPDAAGADTDATADDEPESSDEKAGCSAAAGAGGARLLAPVFAALFLGSRRRRADDRR